jgi:hypothetical protein
MVDPWAINVTVLIKYDRQAGIRACYISTDGPTASWSPQHGESPLLNCCERSWDSECQYPTSHQSLRSGIVGQQN